EDANDNLLHANVITPPSSPGNDATIKNDNVKRDDNNNAKRDALLLPVIELDGDPTATIHPNETDISNHHGGGATPPPPAPQSSSTTTCTAATTATVNETTNDSNNNQTPIDQQTKQKKKPRVQFSLHGEEARQRAMARQRKILSKAHLRLDSISETSLDHIKEVTTTPTATNEEVEEEELIPLVSRRGEQSGTTDESHPSRKTKKIRRWPYPLRHPP
ncbi:hypothetical protein ACHAXH_004713, partial [Discostella pseudostelligera]